MATRDDHPGRPSPAPDPPILAPPGSPTHTGDVGERPVRRCPGHESAETRFFRSYRAAAVLIDRLADLDAILTALEARPASEGPLEACRALTGAPVVEELALGPDDVHALRLLADHPSLSGHFFWKVQKFARRMAVEFGRRLGVPHTDLRPQLLAATVLGALNAALVTWLSDPEGTPVDELMRRALDHLGEGLDWPAGG
ncbi:MAG TPA: hypothetical protein VIL48_03190 [Acidimicrobiales bacterium]